jgi:hypothetical protein
MLFGRTATAPGDGFGELFTMSGALGAAPAPDARLPPGCPGLPPCEDPNQIAMSNAATAPATTYRAKGSKRTNRFRGLAASVAASIFSVPRQLGQMAMCAILAE